ncbi:MAG: hypothetical protein WC757_00385 [Candidatus Paceibacterota bacterium]|jgi:hypothetical protein
MGTRQLLALEEVYGIYCDAWVTDDDDMLVFASFWGRDTTVQELLARLTLSAAEEGINQLYLTGEAAKTLRVGNPGRLDKLTGRMPASNLFGDIVQLWLFDKTVKEPDFANHKAYHLMQPTDVDLGPACWGLLKQVSHLPLLEHWQGLLTGLAKREGWLKVHAGYQLVALAIELPEQALEEHITRLIQAGELTV